MNVFYVNGEMKYGIVQMEWIIFFFLFSPPTLFFRWILGDWILGDV